MHKTAPRVPGEGRGAGAEVFGIDQSTTAISATLSSPLDPHQAAIDAALSALTPRTPAPPVIKIGIGEIEQNAKAAMQALDAQHIIRSNGGVLLELIKHPRGTTTFREITAKRLLYLMATTCRFAKVDGRNDTFRRCDPTPMLASVILAMSDCWPFAPVGVSRAYIVGRPE